MWNKGNSFSADGNVKLCNQFRNSLALSPKVKLMYILLPRDFTLRYIPNRNAYICVPKNMYESVHITIIHNTKNLI